MECYDSFNVAIYLTVMIVNFFGFSFKWFLIVTYIQFISFPPPYNKTLENNCLLIDVVSGGVSSYVRHCHAVSPTPVHLYYIKISMARQTLLQKVASLRHVDPVQSGWISRKMRSASDLALPGSAR